MSGALYAATLATALGCGLIAGVFFAFSSFVMASLKRLPAADGIAAMQSIIIVAITPVFMTALFGTAAACLGLIVWAVISWGDRSATPVLAGAALYLVGAMGTTVLRNVPLNERLAKLHPQDTGATSFWDEYLMKWTAWNHVRTATSLAAATALTAGLQA